MIFFQKENRFIFLKHFKYPFFILLFCFFHKLFFIFFWWTRRNRCAENYFLDFYFLAVLAGDFVSGAIPLLLPQGGANDFCLSPHFLHDSNLFLSILLNGFWVVEVDIKNAFRNLFRFAKEAILSLFFEKLCEFFNSQPELRSNSIGLHFVFDHDGNTLLHAFVDDDRFFV